MEQNKGRTILYFGILLLLLSFALAGAALYVDSGADAKAAVQLSEANRAMNEGRAADAYETYRATLETDPENLGALEGLMQLAADEGNEEELLRLCYIWLNLAEQEGSSNADKRMAVQEQLAVIDDEDVLRQSLKAFDEGKDVQLAYDTLDELPEERLNDNKKKYKAYLLAVLAEDDWKQSEVAAASDKMDHALLLAPEDEHVEEVRALYAREYALSLVRVQDTARGLELAQSLPAAYKKEAEEAVATQDAAAAAIGESFVEIKEALEKDDKESLSRLLNSEGFEKNARNIKGEYYEESLMATGLQAGEGMALYRRGNQSYIYYGGFEDGVRSGEGKWIFAEGEGRLTIFDLQWEDDLPEGRGVREHYSALVSRSEGGGERSRSSTEEKDSISVSRGVITGKYEMTSTVLSDNPYDYSITYELHDGFAPQILPGEYPELIDYYLAYPQPLAGYTEAEAYDPFYEEEYTTTIWYLWTPARWTVDGLNVPPYSAAFQLRTLSLAQ